MKEARNSCIAETILNWHWRTLKINKATSEILGNLETSPLRVTLFFFPQLNLRIEMITTKMLSFLKLYNYRIYRQLLHCCINKCDMYYLKLLAVSVLFFKYLKQICFSEVFIVLSVLPRHPFSSMVSCKSLLISHTSHIWMQPFVCLIATISCCTSGIMSTLSVSPLFRKVPGI